MKKKDNKNIWYWTRITFWLLLLFWFFPVQFLDILFGGLAFVFAVANFVLCILHLRIYKQKGLAITSLIFSSIYIFTVLMGAVIFLSGNPI